MAKAKSTAVESPKATEASQKLQAIKMAMDQIDKQYLRHDMTTIMTLDTSTGKVESDEMSLDDVVDNNKMTREDVFRSVCDYLGQ